jgi:biopolymer transport protein ExbB
MFLSADPLVKGVLIGLAFASVVTWTVWLAKTIELMAASARARRACAKLASARHLAEAAQALAKSGGAGREFIDAAVTELRLSEDGMEREGVKDRLASRLQRIEANRGRIMMRGTGVLATIGATAPFVGLFGTVWGIMNSFIGISKSQTTNLAVVAPGIAEALLATAIGLVAAIPAVVIYNVFSRQIASYRALLADASAEVLRLVGRDLDRAAAPQPRPDKPIFLTVKADLSLALGEITIARETLGNALAAATKGDKDTRIFLRADRTVPYGEMMELMNLMRKAGYLKVAFVGLEKPPVP